MPKKSFRCIAAVSIVVSIFLITVVGASAEDAFRYDNLGLLIDSSDYGYTYGYAPAIVYEDGVFHMFYCSNGKEDYWDMIRYTWSKDGRSWSKPEAVLEATSTAQERCACDPSVVYYDAGDGPYYYLFYSGNKPNVETVMFVARSKDIQGPYSKLTAHNQWVADAASPRIIIYPATVDKVEPRVWYGAGQQTVVVKDGLLYSWYYDDTSKYPHQIGRIFMTITTAPGDWPEAVETNVVNYPSVEVKYDPVNDRFIMFHLMERHQKDSYLVYRTSQDGIVWSTPQTLCDADCFKDFSHNVGVSADREGHLIDERALIVYGAPSSPLDRWMHWDLYGSALNADGSVWNDIPWGWQWPGMGENDSNNGVIDDFLYPYFDQWESSFSGLFGDDPDEDPIRVSVGDYDGDGKTDRAIVDFSSGRWYVISSRTGQPPPDIPWGWQWQGMSTVHVLASGDYDGDGKTDRAIVNPLNGLWYVICSSTGEPPEDIPWGWKWESMPEDSYLVLGDYDGDGKTDRAIVAPGAGRWYVISSRTGRPPPDIPWGWQWQGMTRDFRLALGDYDGDGKTDRAIVHPENGQWYVISSSTGRPPGNIPWGWQFEGMTRNHYLALGDYDGDGITDRGIVNSETGQWFITLSSTGLSPLKIPWGWQWTGMRSEHKLILGDYDGDGITDRAIMDPNTFRWYVFASMPFNIYPTPSPSDDTVIPPTPEDGDVTEPNPDKDYDAETAYITATTLESVLREMLDDPSVEIHVTDGDIFRITGNIFGSSCVSVELSMAEITRPDGIYASNDGNIVVVYDGKAYSLLPIGKDMFSFIETLSYSGATVSINEANVMVFELNNGVELVGRFDYVTSVGTAPSEPGYCEFGEAGSPVDRTTFSYTVKYSDGGIQNIRPWLHDIALFKKGTATMGWTFRIDYATGIIDVFDSSGDIIWRGIPDYVLSESPEDFTGVEFHAIEDKNGDSVSDYLMLSEKGKQILYTAPIKK